MKPKALIGAKILTPNGILEDCALVFTNHIHAIVSRVELDVHAAEIIEVKGLLVPGFIDIHIHGASGFDVMDASKEALDAISKSIVQTGTTSFLATTMTLSQLEIENALREIKLYMALQQDGIASQNPMGARVLGAHLEGPFINPEYKGAQNVDYVQKPSLDWLRTHLDTVKMITYAPEMDDDFSFTKSLKNENIVLSIGHTGCDYETAVKAYHEGMNHVTHCFNAMTGLHHRKPGVVGAALTMPFTIDLITDGIHIHPEFMGPFIKVKGIDHTILITDAMRAAMMTEGVYDLGGQEVVVKDGSCRLCDGTLAGSILTMDQALKNMMAHSDIALTDVVKMLSENPAKKLGIFDYYGSIEVGKKADFVLLTDSYCVCQVYIDGILNYTEA